jgi:hypothetical protein
VNRASRAGSANPTELNAEQTGFLVDASSKQHPGPTHPRIVNR